MQQSSLLRGAPGGWGLRDIGAPVAVVDLSTFSSAHSISFHCHPLIVSTASEGIMYIGRMLLLLVGQLAGRT